MLVITIIVIIILAAAIIISLNNNNPIMESNTARYESDRANMQAVFTNAVAKVMAKNQATLTVSPGQINIITGGQKEVEGEVAYTLTDAQNASNSSGKIVFDNNKLNTDTTFYTGKKLPIYAAGETKWYVDEEGNISLEVAGTIYGSGSISSNTNTDTTASASVVAANPATYYGEKVTNYKTGTEAIDNQVEWQVFHSDGNNIYLITTDYIHYSICPPSKNYQINVNSDYELSIDDIIKDYSGIADFKYERIKQLSSKYFKYVVDNDVTYNHDNMKVIAYMMDNSESVWGNFKGEDADFAVGGPTMELLLESYNKKYNTNYQCFVMGTAGYSVSKDSSDNMGFTIADMFDISDKQYVINSEDRKAEGMWIASSCGNYSSYNDKIFYSYYDGSIDYDSARKEDIGFRPIVCLNSSVELEFSGEKLMIKK